MSLSSKSLYFFISSAFEVGGVFVVCVAPLYLFSISVAIL